MPTPKQFRDQKAAEAAQQAAVYRDIQEAFCRIVQLPGYRYLKRMAFGILKPLKCEPNAPPHEWANYNTARWALESLFSRVEQIAKASPQHLNQIATTLLEPIEDADHGRQPEPGQSTISAEPASL
jgi:hypothetical protein